MPPHGNCARNKNLSNFREKVLERKEEKERNEKDRMKVWRNHEIDTAQRKERLKRGPRDLYKPPRDPWKGHCHTTRRATMDPIKRLQLGERV